MGRVKAILGSKVMEKQISNRQGIGAKLGISGIFQKEDQDLVKLESSLIRAVSELRTKELRATKLSSDFDLRLQNLLQDVRFEEESTWSKISGSFVWNRSFQYSLSAGLAILLLAVAVGRFSSSNETSPSERSGTLVSGNDREFVDLPSSAKVNPDADSPYLQEISKSQDGKKVLGALELYFTERGDFRTAQEIRQVLESTR